MIQAEKDTDSGLAARCAAVACLGAGVIHFAVAPAHWRDWWLSGVFFASLALFQLVWGILAWRRPTGLVLAGGLLINSGAAALWLVSLSAGAPFGPNAGQPEAPDAAGICVLLLQCYSVMGAAWACLRGYGAEPVSTLRRALVLVGANSVMAAAVTVGLASTLQGHHHQPHGVVDSQATRRDGHQHHTDAPGGGVIQPSAVPGTPEEALPVTDMGLTVDGDQSHGESEPAGAHDHG